jgi:transposase-like protein
MRTSGLSGILCAGSMYARGMTVREIQGHLLELYGLEVSPWTCPAFVESVFDFTLLALRTEAG